LQKVEHLCEITLKGIGGNSLVVVRVSRFHFS